jgi:hypothetical protein
VCIISGITLVHKLILSFYGVILDSYWKNLAAFGVESCSSSWSHEVTAAFNFISECTSLEQSQLSKNHNAWVQQLLPHYHSTDG